MQTLIESPRTETLAGNDQLIIHDTLIAQERLRGVVHETPLVQVKDLVPYANASVLLKHEGLQDVRSYKIRGAYGAAVLAKERSGVDRVVTDSAGNHGWGVALSGNLLGLETVVFMPETTPEAKRRPIQKLATKVIEIGSHFSQTVEARKAYCREHPEVTYLPPFDHEDVILHQGTMAAEIFAQDGGRTKHLFVPVGGGGAVSGIAQYAAHARPDVSVIGVQVEGSTSMAQSYRLGRQVRLENVPTFAEGVAVQQAGALTLEKTRAFADGIMVVSTRELAQAVCDLHDAGLTAEGAGALALAGIRRFTAENPEAEGSMVGILSGSNIDAAKLDLARELAM
jgi:threonine dehydratase